MGPFQLRVLCAGEGCGGVRCLRAPQSHPYNIADVVTADVQPDTNGTLLTDRDKATAPRPYRAAVLQSCCRYSWRRDTPLGWSWEPRAPLQCSPLLTGPRVPSPPSQGISPGSQCSYTAFRIPGVPGVPSLPPTPRPVCLGASPRPESPHGPAGGGRLTIAHKGRMSPPSLPLGPSSRKAPGGGGPGPTGRTVDGLCPVEATLLRAAPGERVGVPGDGWRKRRRRRMCSIVSTFR